MTPEQLRWGFEHLDLTEARIKELGAGGLFPPIKTSCMDHEGSGMVKFQMWDGAGFKQVTPFMAGDRAMVRKMVEETAGNTRPRKRSRRAIAARKASPDPTVLRLFACGRKGGARIPPLGHDNDARQ
jgi:branched-chain amino acid transport system substrate-binding protein